MAILKTEGIVLKTFDFRETSRIAVFFTRRYGKVSGVLKGFRRDPRKFATHLGRRSVNDIVYYAYRNSDLHLISQCDLKVDFPFLRQDVKKGLAADYGLELVYRLMPVELENEGVYLCLKKCLQSLETMDDVNRVVRIFQIKVLSLSGFKPHLDACVGCRRVVTSEAAFSHKEGGLICPRCVEGHADLEPISRSAVESILFVERSTWEESLRLSLMPSVGQELKSVLNNFLVYHLGRKIRSAQFV